MDEVCSQPRFLFKIEVDEDFTDNLVINLHLLKNIKLQNMLESLQIIQTNYKQLCSS